MAMAQTKAEIQEKFKVLRFNLEASGPPATELEDKAMKCVVMNVIDLFEGLCLNIAEIAESS